MGKTGTTQWVQVKGVKGQIRLVPKSEGEVKRPGPNQRFRAGATLKKLEQLAGDQGGRQGRPWRQGPRHGKPGRHNRPEINAPCKSIDNGRKAEVSPIIWNTCRNVTYPGSWRGNFYS
jgi:hypothetical protein